MVRSRSGAVHFREPSRIYTRDQYGRLAVLDAKTGARIATLKLPQSVKALMNDQSDRLVLSTEDGLIQSLHETALEQPYLNMPPKIECPKKEALSRLRPMALLLPRRPINRPTHSPPAANKAATQSM